MASALHDESAAHWFGMSTLVTGPLPNWDWSAPLRQDGRLGFSESWSWVVMPAVSFLVLFGFGGHELHTLMKTKPRSRTSQKANTVLWLKMGLCATLAVTQAVALVLQLTGSQSSFVSLDASPLELIIGSRLLDILAFGAAIPLHWQAFHKLKHSSTSLLFFWLAQIISHAAQLNNLILDARTVTPLAAIQIALLTQQLVVFTAELYGPEDFEPAIKLGEDDTEEDVDYSGGMAPEEKANMFVTFATNPSAPLLTFSHRQLLDFLLQLDVSTSAICCHLRPC